MSMNWKALLITIGIFAAIAALIWLCVVYNIIGFVVLGFFACAFGIILYLVYSMVKDIIEERNGGKQG